MKPILFALTLTLLVTQAPTLSPFCVGAKAAQRLAAQQEPGNPGHKEPPAGWYCSTHSPEAAKRCACHRVDTHPLCEGEPTEDNATCLVACHRAHCHCAVECRPQ